MGQQVKILLVENKSSTSIAPAFLENSQNFKVDTVNSASEALKTISRRKYHLIFVDSNLADSNSLNLLRQIKAISPDLPVVVLSDSRTNELAVSFLKEGTADYLIKNSDYSQILPILSKNILNNENPLEHFSIKPRFSAEKIYEQIVNSAAELLAADAASFMLLNHDTYRLEIKASRGLGINYIKYVNPLPGQSLEGKALSEKTILTAHNLTYEKDYQYKDIAREAGMQSALAAPVIVDNQTKGVLNLYSRSPNKFKEKDKKVVCHLVKLSVLALENLKSYQHEHKIARTLQESHFSDIAPELGQWEIAHRYKASMQESMLGGDFYDLFRLNDDLWAMVLADVSGKGLRAARQTAQVKYSIRSYALDDPDPISVMLKTDQAFCSFAQGEHFVTIFYGLLDINTHCLTYCTAGHPAPLFYSHKQEKLLALENPSLPIGINLHPLQKEISAQTLHFYPGDCLLIYTDGVTDCRQNGLKEGAFLGEKSLQQLFLQLVSFSASEIATRLFEFLIDYCAGKLRDDLAFFVLKLKES